MTCVNCPPIVEQYGANPKVVQWNVVRGDTASLRIEFWEDDETTAIDTSGWTYKATAYDTVSDTLIDLDVEAIGNIVDISATPAETALWGSGYASVVAELPFDLEITTDGVVWTPVVGTICVYSDVSPGGSL